MTGLTGVKDIDLKILQSLSDIDLCNICSTNKRLYKVCNEESFWINRLLLKMSSPDNNIETINELRDVKNKENKDKQISHKELYICLFSKNKKEALFKSVQLDNTILFRKVRSLDKNNIYSYNSDMIEEAARYNSFNILTYLLINHTGYYSYDKVLVNHALIFANVKVFEWLNSMGLVDYDEYIKIWIGDINYIEIKGRDLYFVKLSLRLNDENLKLIIKLYDIISQFHNLWKDAHINIPTWIDEGLIYSSASENIKNKLRSYVRNSLHK